MGKGLDYVASASCPQEPDIVDAVAAERQRCADIVESMTSDGTEIRYALHAIRNPDDKLDDQLLVNSRSELDSEQLLQATEDVASSGYCSPLIAGQLREAVGSLAGRIRQSINDGTFAVASTPMPSKESPVAWVVIDHDGAPSLEMLHALPDGGHNLYLGHAKVDPHDDAYDALEPLARLASSYFYRYETRPGEFRESHENDPDDRVVYGINSVVITTGDLRRARKVMENRKASLADAHSKNPPSCGEDA